MNARLCFLTDEDFDNDIVRGLLCRSTDRRIRSRLFPVEFAEYAAFFLAYRDRLLPKRQMPSGKLIGEKSKTASGASAEDLKQRLLERPGEEDER